VDPEPHPYSLIHNILTIQVRQYVHRNPVGLRNHVVPCGRTAYTN